MRLETLEIRIRIEAPPPQRVYGETQPYSQATAEALQAAVDAAVAAVKAQPYVEFVGVGYGIPRTYQ